jgi:phosphoglycolate phosphatase-like HAD superfamily hydrolase
MNLLLDFDGTLVDIADKYWWAYTEFFLARGAALPDRAAFWSAKRDGADEARLLVLAAQNPSLAGELRQHIRNTIETEPALMRDRPLPGIIGLLSGLGEKHSLVLVSARADPRKLRGQIERLGFLGFLSEIITADEDCGALRTGETPKSRVLEGSRWLREPAIMIGDAKMDVDTAKALGIPSCAVLSGIRSHSFLDNLRPDYIIDSVFEIAGVLARL